LVLRITGNLAVRGGDASGFILEVILDENRVEVVPHGWDGSGGATLHSMSDGWAAWNIFERDRWLAIRRASSGSRFRECGRIRRF